MNTPQGFTLAGRTITNIQPLTAMFNPATPSKVAHVLSSAYMTSAFVLASIAAYSLLKNRTHVYYRKALRFTMVSALVFSVTTAFVGDLSGKFLAVYQPEKLAAAEWHFETVEKAPLLIGGVLTHDNEVKFAIKIPFALSILAHGNPAAEVKGLDQIAKENTPPLFIHYLFDAMVGIGILLSLVSLMFVVSSTLRRWNPYNRILLRLIVASGPLALLAIEFGWIFARWAVSRGF